MMGVATQHSPAVCAKFHRAVELIGARWTGAIVQLLMSGPARYCALRAAVPEISDRMLSERLRELEEEGVVERMVFPETPVRVEYKLTTKGEALEPALKALGKWAEKYVDPGAKPSTRSGGASRSAVASAKAEAPPATRRRG
jgi:DNA-binding HxlR family transcriptional regulator